MPAPFSLKDKILLVVNYLGSRYEIFLTSSSGHGTLVAIAMEKEDCLINDAMKSECVISVWKLEKSVMVCFQKWLP